MKLDKMLCHKDKTLLDVLEVINNNGYGVAFIVDDRKKIYGLLTDGDIRRLLLKGHALQEKAGSVANPKFVYAEKSETYNEMLAKTNNAIRILPIVDEKFRIHDYFVRITNLRLPVADPDLKGKEFQYLVEAFLSTWISSKGEYIKRFENNFSAFCDCNYGVAVSNGTVALHLALVALGIGKGDEVIVPDLTFAATINAVLHANATPVIVDIELDSWCIDPNEVKRAISPRTKAIIPVHLYGQPCDMDKIMIIAKKNKLFVIEDCAEAHGAVFNAKKVGSFGNIGCFSFFANKVITTGEGGMCVTNSKQLYEKMKMLRDHGMSQTKKYWHDLVGYNYRMTNMQAAIGCAQLERIGNILKNRQAFEEKYREYFKKKKGFVLQKNDLKKRDKITWLTSILVENEDRDAVIARLREKGIDTREFFYPLSQMDIYKKYVFSSKNSIEISRKGISLPTYNELKKANHILKVLNEVQ